MKTITVITIIVVALLTIIIFGLAWLGYTSCIKAYKIEVNQGQHDQLILTEVQSKRKKGWLIGTICSYTTLSLLLGLFVTGIIYKARGENLQFNNTTVLVIKSASMADFYHTEDKNKYDVSLQFDMGDMCAFRTDFTDLIIGDVYGYKYKDIIITHRLISYDEENKAARFKGDSNPSNDPFYVPREKIIYHYTGDKVKGVGAFVLYAQSYFGIWSLCGVIGIAVSSEIVYRKLNKINKRRYATLRGNNDA